MKPNKQLFQFPDHLPNDLEGFIFFYPSKFPPIVPLYERLAEKYFQDPAGFEAYTRDSLDGLQVGLDKIKADYEAKENKNLDFLVEIDYRLHKLYAYKFWVVNYLFPDGPLHEFYVSNIKEYSHKLADVTDGDFEEFEADISQIERDLLQGDYADLYLRNALKGVKFMENVRKDAEMLNIINEVSELIDKDEDSKEAIHDLLDPIIDIAQKEEGKIGEKLSDALQLPMVQADFRNTRTPIYHFIIHSIEYEEENENLQDRHEAMSDRVDQLLNLAEDRLSSEEAEELRVSYKMSNKLAMSKDIVGSIDPAILPFWISLLEDIASAIPDYTPKKDIGPGAMFYELVWHLPDHLTQKVMTPDREEFDLNRV